MSKPTPAPTVPEQIGVKAARKLAARRARPHGVGFGLGMMGLVGWSVVVPTMIGAALGVWLDARHPASFSWTLALLVAGLVLGCLNAWRWIVKEQSVMSEGGDDE